MTLETGQPGKRGLNAQKREFLFVSLLTTLIVFLIALLLAMRWARSITRPVMKMHRAVRRIGAGDLETKFTLHCNIHELHELANGLRDMTGQLLRDRDIMESRILDATDDLRVKKEEAEQAESEQADLNQRASRPRKHSVAVGPQLDFCIEQRSKDRALIALADDDRVAVHEPFGPGCHCAFLRPDGESSVFHE